MKETRMTCLDLCSGLGGQALGLERAGFQIVGVVEQEADPAATLHANRPDWRVLNSDVRELGTQFKGVDLIAAGAPCTPFSAAGSGLGSRDTRDVLPEVARIALASRPKAIMIENVGGLLLPRHAAHLDSLVKQLASGGYLLSVLHLNAADLGLPQTRRRVFLIGILNAQLHPPSLSAPDAPPNTVVGELLLPLMAARGWPGATAWSARADGPGPTIVGGSTRHGGADLGPSGTRARWKELAVDGRSVADQAPAPAFPISGMPRLTIPMVAALQGLPADWSILGTKTSRYRQVGNALPPVMAYTAGVLIRDTLRGAQPPPRQ
jgi:DNA (cytosine-5)-methyltransferase 1